MNKKAVLPQGNRAMPQVFFSVEVHQQHYKYKTSQSSKATLQSSKHAGAKHNVTKSGFKVNQSYVFGVSGKAVRQ